MVRRIKKISAAGAVLIIAAVVLVGITVWYAWLNNGSGKVFYSCYNKGDGTYVRCTTAAEPSACLGTYYLKGSGLQSGILTKGQGGTCEGLTGSYDVLYDKHGKFISGYIR